MNNVYFVALTVAMRRLFSKSKQTSPYDEPQVFRPDNEGEGEPLVGDKPFVPKRRNMFSSIFSPSPRVAAPSAEQVGGVGTSSGPAMESENPAYADAPSTSAVPEGLPVTTSVRDTSKNGLAQVEDSVPLIDIPRFGAKTKEAPTPSTPSSAAKGPRGTSETAESDSLMPMRARMDEGGAVQDFAPVKTRLRRQAALETSPNTPPVPDDHDLMDMRDVLGGKPELPQAAPDVTPPKDAGATSSEQISPEQAGNAPQPPGPEDDSVKGLQADSSTKVDPVGPHTAGNADESNLGSSEGTGGEDDDAEDDAADDAGGAADDAEAGAEDVLGAAEGGEDGGGEAPAAIPNGQPSGGGHLSEGMQLMPIQPTMNADAKGQKADEAVAAAGSGAEVVANAIVPGSGMLVAGATTGIMDLIDHFDPKTPPPSPVIPPPMMNVPATGTNVMDSSVGNSISEQ